MALLFCPSCGRRRFAQLRYCAGCGFDFDSVTSAWFGDRAVGEPQKDAPQIPAPTMRPDAGSWEPPPISDRGSFVGQLIAFPGSSQRRRRKGEADPPWLGLHGEAGLTISRFLLWSTVAVLGFAALLLASGGIGGGEALGVSLVVVGALIGIPTLFVVSLYLIAAGFEGLRRQ
jgi:hypothetical protein